MLNRGHVYESTVPSAHAGRELLAYHVACFTRVPASLWEERIAAGLVRVNGEPRGLGHALAEGDVVTFHRPPWEEPDAPLTFAVVYEDDDVLIVDKPSGLQVQPGGPFSDKTLLHQVQTSAPHRARAANVHRLGRGTSGLVLFGQSREARADLSAQFREAEPCKTYLAWVRGTALPCTVQARHPIGAVPHGPLTIWCARPEGKASHTRVRVLARDPARDRTLVAAQPITGRPDQIRIHLAASGAPIVGDELFGVGGGIASDVPPGKGGYLLHAAGLWFRHPRHGRQVKARARPPWPTHG